MDIYDIFLQILIRLLRNGELTNEQQENNDLPKSK